MLITIIFLNIINFSFIYSFNKSSCSPNLFLVDIDIRTNHQYVYPCPVSKPCQCLCHIETQRLWIDCFHRQLKTLPTFETISTKNSTIEWNIDLAFNLFDNLNTTAWIPDGTRIGYLIFSGSLAYDLIVQLNLTHRHLIDMWYNQQHLSTIHDSDDQDRSINDYEDDYDNVEQYNSSIVPSDHHHHTRILSSLTMQLKDKTKKIKSFALSLAGVLSSGLLLYLDHNALDSVPIEALYNETSLYELYLSHNNITHLPAYSFGFSHRLTRLDLSYNQISYIDNFTFQRHPKAYAGPFLIDYLDLSHNQLAILEPNIFSYLVNLRFLKLEHNQIYSLSVHSWTGLYRLKYLDLSHNFIQNFTQAFYSSYLNELKQLKITSNNITHLNSCEFLSLRALNKLSLDGNSLSSVDTCAFYGLPHKTAYSSLHIYLRSNHFETLHPCSFIDFAHSTIHVENNPLICNCTFNYLLYERKSLAYTGQECRGGFSYEPYTQYSSPAIRKTNKVAIRKKFINRSTSCRTSYKYYNNLCSQLDCISVCKPNERFIVQITTIATPSKTISKFQRTADSCFIVLLYVILKDKIETAF